MNFSHFNTNNARVACIILSGGKGTRLLPLTESRCKPSVSFGGKFQLIDIPISNAINSDIHSIFVISQYCSSTLNKHIIDTYSMHLGKSIHLLTPEERFEGRSWYSGTADAIRKNLNTFQDLSVDYFLILSGDQLYNMDLQKMVECANMNNADLTIASLPINKSDAPRLGLLNIDTNSKIIDFIEKPKNPDLLNSYALSDEFIENHDIHTKTEASFLASMGIYLFKKEVLIQALNSHPGEDFGQHIIPDQLKHKSCYAFLYKGYWEDIGTISSYYHANLAISKNASALQLYNDLLPIYSQYTPLPGTQINNTSITNSIICEGCILECATVSNSIVGLRSVIKKNTHIADSILMGNTSFSNPKDGSIFYGIGEDCNIKKSIIEHQVSIGNHVQLINKKQLKTFDGDGIAIREGIIIIKSGTTIPDHFVI